MAKFEPVSGSQHPPKAGVQSPGPMASDPGQATHSNLPNAVERPPNGIRGKG
jgi:hypothetical protein